MVTKLSNHVCAITWKIRLTLNLIEDQKGQKSSILYHSQRGIGSNEGKREEAGEAGKKSWKEKAGWRSNLESKIIKWYKLARGAYNAGLELHRARA